MLRELKGWVGFVRRFGLVIVLVHLRLLSRDISVIEGRPGGTRRPSRGQPTRTAAPEPGARRRTAAPRAAGSALGRAAWAWSQTTHAPPPRPVTDHRARGTAQHAPRHRQLEA